MRKLLVGLVALMGIALLPAPPASAAYPDSVCDGQGSVVNKQVLVYTHNRNKVGLAFCVMKTSTAGQDYFWARLRFTDPDLPNQSGVADKIEIEYLRLNDRVTETTDPDASCDQTNDWTQPPFDQQSNDGRGCNRGNYSGSGPCQGFTTIVQSPLAFGPNGCQRTDGDGDPRVTTFAQTNKVNGRETDTATCDATIQFRIQWKDGTNSAWQSPSLASAC